VKSDAIRAGKASAFALAMLALLAGGAVGVFGWTQHRESWWPAYLVAWLFWTGLSLGSLSLLLLHNLTGGAWGDAVRPLLRGAANVLPLLGLLFLPIALAPEHLYHWAEPHAAEHDAILAHKAPYLNVQWFQIRTACYFALWLTLLLLLAWQGGTSAPDDSRRVRRFSRLSGQGLALHGLAVTFASIDWMMSLEPHWFSTIYGVMIFAGQGLAALALAVSVLCAGSCCTSTPRVVDGNALHDLGKLLLGFVMLWAYLSFSQFFIIWNGNLPEEVTWYLKRIAGAWKWWAVAIVLLHFVAPFVLLLGRQLKRTPPQLGAVATLIVVMHWAETVWLVQPAIERAPSVIYWPWLDLALTAAIGGAWWVAFALLTPRNSDIHAQAVGGRT
jgi:hypothetical protein